MYYERVFALFDIKTDFSNFKTRSLFRVNSRKSRCQSCRICHVLSQLSYRPALAMHFWASPSDSRQTWFNATRISAKIKFAHVETRATLRNLSKSRPDLFQRIPCRRQSSYHRHRVWSMNEEPAVYARERRWYRRF